MARKKYRRISIPEELWNEIQRYITENPGLGYKTVGGLCRQALRYDMERRRWRPLRPGRPEESST